MKCYFSKINKVVYGKYPYSFVITLKGDEGKMGAIKIAMEKKIKEMVKLLNTMKEGLKDE